MPWKRRRLAREGGMLNRGDGRRRGMGGSARDMI